MNMDRYNCWYLRIRGNKDFDVNYEDHLEKIEKLYKTHLGVQKQWDNLKQRTRYLSSICKNKVREAYERKAIIINKLYVQCSRPTPFELTDRLFRTANKWQTIVNKKRKISSIINLEITSSDSEIEQNSSKLSEVAHPNTETLVSDDLVASKIFKNIKVEENFSELSSPVPHRPLFINTNQHKLVSPLQSKDSFINNDTSFRYEKNLQDIPEWIQLKHTTLIKSIPTEIYIRRITQEEQSISFSLINTSSETTIARFKCITDHSCFKNIEMIPQTPLRLYPGISANYKLKFKLAETEQDFESNLCFRIKNNDHLNNKHEVLLIRIISKFHRIPSISVTETVNLHPVYPWQIKFGYPKACLRVITGDRSKYILRISKRFIDYAKEYENGLSSSLEGISPNTESINRRAEDDDMEQLEEFSKMECLETNEETSRDIADDILNKIVEQALDVFVFDRTFAILQPKSKQNIPVYFTKAEHIGKHQSCYHVHFYDEKEQNIIATKNIKVFGEVLRHPIQIYPTFLDMTESVVTQGFYEDNILITNTHAVYPVLIKIKAASVVKKLIHITPMSTLIPTSSSVQIQVRLCSKDQIGSGDHDDFVHFTIKIIVTGDKSIYDKVPPFYYEIIAPCASYFKKIKPLEYIEDDPNISTIEGLTI